MTDQLVMLARNDEAVLGVLGHELGHLQRRHTLRRMLQAAGTGVIVNLWMGDVSSLLATIPTILLDSKYSRDFEREADQYGIDMMRANGIPMEPMAQLFEKMKIVGEAHQGKKANEQANERKRTKRRRDEDDEKVSEPNEYFSSHPSDTERIARFRAADKQ